ncbi:PhoD-like phosphatase-domain-containing protein [Blastocladiella britannica]|nr:PhoD-like phosphatase-domain-containing protein [Blastocladiella britannica]
MKFAALIACSLLALTAQAVSVPEVAASFEANLAFGSPFANVPELAIKPSPHHFEHVLAKRAATAATVRFPYGIASGDPLSNALILWTKVEPSVTSAPVPVSWEIAVDAAFTNVVGRGSVLTTDDIDWTVKVDATGLAPLKQHWYRFTSQGTVSPVGSARTLPAAETAVDHVRLASVSCSNMPHGFFHAYARITDRVKAGDVDLVLELGDYVYDQAPTTTIQSGRLGGDRAPQPMTNTVTLADYRLRHSQYKRDPDAQAMHAVVAMIAIMDDHELVDNANKDNSHEHDPKTQGPFSVRRAAAVRAWHEYMPVRSLPDVYHIYRDFQYGTLAHIVFPDTRIEARDSQAVGDRNTRRMMSDEQQQWFHAKLSEPAQWRVIANQVMMAPIPESIPVVGKEIEMTADTWNGYPRNRNGLFNHVANNRLNNTLVLTGDFHASLVSNLFVEGSKYDKSTGNGAIMVEFVGPSVTSQTVAQDRKWASELIKPAMSLVNAGYQWGDFYRHGYMVLDLTPGRARNEYYYMDNVKVTTGGSETKGAVFEIASGANKVTKAYFP